MLTENDLTKIIDENQAALLRYAERLLREDLLAQVATVGEIGDIVQTLSDSH